MLLINMHLRNKLIYLSTMSNELYLITYNNENFGIFSDLNKSIIYILGHPLFNISSIDMWNISSIYIDSCFINNKFKFKNNKCEISLIKNDNVFYHKLITIYNKRTDDIYTEDIYTEDIDTEDIDTEDIDDIKNLITETNDIQYKLNLLKKDKEKLEEKKNIFEIDKKLYFNFKESLETDNDFIVPEIFINKYKIFRKLDEENNINWEDFNKFFIPEDLNTSYNSLFYKEQFLDRDDLVESSSDSESSENI